MTSVLRNCGTAEGQLHFGTGQHLTELSTKNAFPILTNRKSLTRNLPKCRQDLQIRTRKFDSGLPNPSRWRGRDGPEKKCRPLMLNIVVWRDRLTARLCSEILQMKNIRTKGRNRAPKASRKAGGKRRRRAQAKASSKPRKLLKFATRFRHYQSGVVYYARDYGHRAWPFHIKAA